MSAVELIESVIECSTDGVSLKDKEVCKYKKSYLRDKELYLLLNSDYVEYEVVHDCYYDYIIIRKK